MKSLAKIVVALSVKNGMEEEANLVQLEDKKI